MKTNSILTVLLSLGLVCCGPNEADLRAELQSIDAELVQLRTAAYRYQSQMNQAEFASFIGSFAAGYGATSGDYGLAGDGAGTVIEAAGNHEVASYSLEQIKQRHSQLISRRNEVVRQLN